MNIYDKKCDIVKIMDLNTSFEKVTTHILGLYVKSSENFNL